MSLSVNVWDRIHSLKGILSVTTLLLFQSGPWGFCHVGNSHSYFLELMCYSLLVLGIWEETEKELNVWGTA